MRPDSYTTKQVAGILGVTDRQLRGWVDRGLPMTEKPAGSGSRWVWTKRDVVRALVVKTILPAYSGNVAVAVRLVDMHEYPFGGEYPFTDSGTIIINADSILGQVTAGLVSDD